jgi:hypothetical protein
MTPAEAAVLLSKISANDGREVTESAALAWAEALADCPLQDALDALPGYYRHATRDTRNWIYPGDVLAGAKRVQRNRRVDVYRAAFDRALAENPAVDDTDELTRELAEHAAKDAARKTATEALKTYTAERPQLERPDSGFTTSTFGGF